MNLGSVLGGILKTVLLAGLSAVGVALGDPSTFVGLGAFAAIGVAAGLFLSKLVADFLAKQAPISAALSLTRYGL